MGRKQLWMAGLAALVVTGGVALLGAGSAAALPAQINQEPQDCACSGGINVGTKQAPVVLKQCICGQLQCAVLPSSGQLQCAR